MGDLFLHASDKDGPEFFGGMKKSLDVVLKHFPAVHYHFYANHPPKEPSEDYSEPPPLYEFLVDLFGARKNATSGEGGGFQTQRASFYTDMDLKTTVYNQMNADMVVTTGSSFAIVAPTLSTKPVVIFTKSKEGGHFPVYLRPDYAIMEDDGTITKPTVSELQAHVVMRYAEIHHKLVPYN